MTDWIFFGAIYAVAGALAALYTVVENVGVPTYFDKANPWLRGVAWLVWLLAIVVVFLVNRAWSRNFR